MYEPRVESPSSPAGVGKSAYGTCARRVSPRGDGLDEQGNFCGVPAEDRGCNTLNFKRFSRSVRLAQHLYNSSLAPPHAPPAAEEELPVEPRTPFDYSNDYNGLVDLIRESAILLTVLFLLSALAITSVQLKWGPVPVFFLCFFGLIPLAILVGDLTELLSGWCGTTLGGLLNATLGNVTEAIVLVQAVRHGLVGVEQAALLGGVLSNMLLVVGLSFIFGGIATGGTQTFDRRVTLADIGVLLVSVIAIVLPTIAASAPGGSERDTLADTRSTAALLLLMYAAFLVYTLSPSKEVKKVQEVDPESVQLLPLSASKSEATVAEKGDAEEEEELPSMSLWTLLILMSLVTINMAILSNALVLNVFPVSAALNITPDLVSCIFLPIIGNIAELTTAVIAARRGAVDLSLAVAFGSSTQISLFLLPMAAMLGWAIGVPFSFDFSPTFTTAFFASVIVVAVVVSDGEATWLKGVMLCGTYTVFAIGLLTNAGAAGVGGPASAPAASQAYIFEG